MKIYIASKYIKHKEINRTIFNLLKKEGIDAFLPESIDIDASTPDEMYEVSEKCYNEIDKCDVILIVAPCGNSVSSEIGYAISKKRLDGSKRLVLFNPNRRDGIIQVEVMIAPYIDFVAESVYQLIKYLVNEI